MMADLVDARAPQDYMQYDVLHDADAEHSFSFYLFDVDDDEIAALVTPCIVSGNAHSTFQSYEHASFRSAAAIPRPQIDIKALDRVLSAE